MNEIMRRRRGLMAQKSVEPKTPILPACPNWIYRNGANYPNQSLSDDSFYLNFANDWNHYFIAFNTLTKKYSELIGKTVVVEVDVSGDAGGSFSLGVISVGSGSKTMSDIKDRRSIGALTTGHNKKEIVIGTGYTTTYPNYYLTVLGFANSETLTSRVTYTNFKCYVKGE